MRSPLSHSKNNQFYELILKNKDTSLNKFQSLILNFKNSKKIGYPIQLNLKDLKISERLSILGEIIFKKNYEPNNYHDWLLLNYGHLLTENYYKPYTKILENRSKEDGYNRLRRRLAQKNIYKTLYSLLFKNKKVT